MATVGAYEAKTHLPQLLERVAAGETITITKHGREVAKLVPADPRAAAPDDVIVALRRAREGLFLRGDSVSDMLAEGRRE